MPTIVLVVVKVSLKQKDKVLQDHGVVGKLGEVGRTGARHREPASGGCSGRCRHGAGCIRDDVDHRQNELVPIGRQLAREPSGIAPRREGL